MFNTQLVEATKQLSGLVRAKLSSNALALLIALMIRGNEQETVGALQEALGARRQDGARAKRDVLLAAADEASTNGLLEIEEAGAPVRGQEAVYTMRVLAPVESQDPVWGDADLAIARLFDLRPGPGLLAAGARLAHAAGASGQLDPTRAELSGLLRCDRKSALTYLEQLTGSLVVSHHDLPRAEGERAARILIQLQVPSVSVEATEEASGSRPTLPDASSEASAPSADIGSEAEEAAGRVWHPELVAELIKQAEKRAGRKLGVRRRLDKFVYPVLEMQDEVGNHAGWLKYALEATVKNEIVLKPKTRNWTRYTRSVLANNEANFKGRLDTEEPAAAPASEKPAAPAVKKAETAPPAKSEAPALGQDKLRDYELQMRDYLRHCAELNSHGEFVNARSSLKVLLGAVPALVGLFDGDEELCRQSIIEAFKQGRSDFVGIQPNPYGLDFAPEWTWSYEPAQEPASG